MSDIPVGNGTQWRLGSLENRVKRIEDLEPAVVKQQVSDLHDDMRSLKRALYTAALSFAGGSVLFAFTAFQIWGGR